MVGSTTNLAIISDYPFVKIGIEDYFKSNKLIQVKNEIKSYEQIIKQVGKNKITFVIVAAVLPAKHIQEISVIKRKRKDLKAIFITLRDRHHVRHAIHESDFDGYVNFDKGLPEVSKAIKQISSGNKYFNFPVNSALKKKDTKRIKSPVKKLSKGELKVVKLICDEYTAGEMAELLGLSRRTLENRVENILRKTNSKNRIGIVKYAIKNKHYTLK